MIDHTKEKPDVLFGHQVFSEELNDRYIIERPVKHGMLNL